MVALLIALMFLPSMGGAIGSPSIEALFFSRFGVEFLPYMYMALGGVTFITSLLITILLDRASRKRLYLSLPGILALALIIARILVSFDFNWFYPVLWLGMYLLWALQALLTWGIAGTVCDTRQAKRLFPLFGAGGILGVALGGFITPPLIAVIGTENLLAVWAITLVISLVLVGRLMRFSQAQRKPSKRRAHPSIIDGLQHGYRFVRASELMRWIALMAVLLALLFFSLAFPFSKAIAAEYPNEDDLAGFFGVFQGLTTAVAFAAAFFFANRLYARFGFMVVLLAYPVIYVVGFGSVSATAAVTPLIVFRFVQVAWYQGVAATAYQAIFNLVPAARREQTRTFIDGVPGQVGNVLAGLLLLASEEFLRTEHLFYIGAVAALATTYVVWKAKVAYNGALAEALRAGQHHIFFSEEQPFGGFQRDADAVAVALAGVSSDDVATRRIAVEILGNLPVPQAADALVERLTDEDAQVRAGALRSLAQAQVTPALLEVAARLDDPEPDVRLGAVDALQKLTTYRRGLATRFDKLLNDPDPGVRCQVAVMLLQSGERPDAADTLHELIRSAQLEDRIAALQGFAAWGDISGYEVARESLDDPNPTIRRYAVIVLGRVKAEVCTFTLVNQGLADKDSSVVETAARALGELGAPMLKPVIAALDNPALESGALLALGNLPIEQEGAALRAYARKKVERALHYHQFGVELAPLAHLDLRDGLLCDLVHNRACYHGECALRSIGLLDGERDAIYMAIDNLDSDDANQRANALEMLDSMHDRDIAHPVLQIWENGSNPTQATNGSPPERKALIMRAMQDEDLWIRATAALSACHIADDDVISSLEELAKLDPEALVCEMAVNSLNGSNLLDTMLTLNNMERVLFLHQVPIFAALPPEELMRVAEIGREMVFSDGEIITHEGDIGDEIYIIVNGEISVLTQGADGAQAEVARKTAGQYVGEMAVISHEPRTATLQAVGDVRVLTIEQDEFEEILRERPEISLVIMRALIDLLRQHHSGHQA